ncbi:hypothetical protein PoB_004583100 [Plakobranchus ocellatus]|uniref:Uncharacterized protein n=1 Tax=Plakobranchus ocellatus TaxID=259542 RepID=A0AAV4BFW2_9GAST|nr:hypothetical protein PoB_004583100 [Plakobranchus ocellatus]
MIILLLHSTCKREKTEQETTAANLTLVKSSFLSFSKLAIGRPEIRQQQLSTTVHDVFTIEGLNGVPLEFVKASLFDLLKELDVK